MITPEKFSSICRKKQLEEEALSEKRYIKTKEAVRKIIEKNLARGQKLFTIYESDVPLRSYFTIAVGEVAQEYRDRDFRLHLNHNATYECANFTFFPQ